MDRKKIFLVVLFVVLIAAVITIFLSPKKDVKTPTKQPVSIQKPIDLCASFPAEQGEISCNEAVNTSLKKFPGDIVKITKTRIGTRPQAGVESALRDVWSVEINLRSPYTLPNGKIANSLAVQVDRVSKEILAFKAVAQ